MHVRYVFSLSIVQLPRYLCHRPQYAPAFPEESVVQIRLQKSHGTHQMERPYTDDVQAEFLQEEYDNQYIVRWQDEIHRLSRSSRNHLIQHWWRLLTKLLSAGSTVLVESLKKIVA